MTLAGIRLVSRVHAASATIASLRKYNPTISYHLRAAPTVKRHGSSSFASMSYRTPTGTYLHTQAASEWAGGKAWPEYQLLEAWNGVKEKPCRPLASTAGTEAG